jgi:hypothetical protein
MLMKRRTAGTVEIISEDKFRAFGSVKGILCFVICIQYTSALDNFLKWTTVQFSGYTTKFFAIREYIFGILRY